MGAHRWTILRQGSVSQSRRQMRTLATPEPIKDWSLMSAKVVSHGRYVAFQMADVAIPRNLFADVLRLIAELRPQQSGGCRLKGVGHDAARRKGRRSIGRVDSLPFGVLRLDSDEA